MDRGRCLILCLAVSVVGLVAVGCEQLVPTSSAGPASTTDTSKSTGDATSNKPATPTSTSPVPAGYTIYRNARFGFSFAVPVSFRPDGNPPVNGDGQSFSAAGGQVTVNAYGSYNVNNDTTATLEAAGKAREKARNGTITLDQQNAHTYTLSGYEQDGKVIWYEHAIIEPHTEYFIDWKYPTALRAETDPEVTASVNTFVPGPNS